MKTTELMRVLINRDGMTQQEAYLAVENARSCVFDDNEDPEEVLREHFGLEPDYVFDLLY